VDPNWFKFDVGPNAALRALAAAAAAQQADLQASMVTTLVPAMQQVAAAYKPVVTASVASDMMRHAVAALEPARMVSAWPPKIIIPGITVPVVPKISMPTGMFDVLQGFDWDAFERRIRTPVNWPNFYEPYLPGLVSMVNEEGIPIAWVPRWEPFMPSVHEMLNACRYGLWKVAAMASVAMTHSIVESLAWVTDRQRVAKHHALKRDVTLSEVIERAARGPLVLFYDDWNPKSRRPRPMHLTRHVISHRFGPEQVIERNCIVAVMLLASLMATVDQLELSADHDGS
jgi:hypothetical protein